MRIVDILFSPRTTEDLIGYLSQKSTCTTLSSRTYIRMTASYQRCTSWYTCHDSHCSKCNCYYRNSYYFSDKNPYQKSVVPIHTSFYQCCLWLLYDTHWKNLLLNVESLEWWHGHGYFCKSDCDLKVLDLLVYYYIVILTVL